jgi:hypothetical protein
MGTPPPPPPPPPQSTMHQKKKKKKAVAKQLCPSLQGDLANVQVYAR